MATILITGANGFIGAHYARRMRAQGWQVVGADLQPGDASGACDIYRALDLASPEGRAALAELPPAEVILHAGGISGFMVATDRPGHIVDVNVVGTMAVLEFARRRGVRRTVLCSTIMAYGPDTVPDEERRESEYPRPISTYGASKVAVEALMHGHFGQYGTDAVALRFSHVYGPGRSTQCFVRDMLAAVRDGTPCRIPHARQSLRQYVHVDDVCTSIALAFDAPAAKLGARVYNISAGEIHTLAEVSEAVRRAVGEPSVGFGTEDLLNYRVGLLSLDAARRDLGYEPAIPLATGVRRYWEADFAAPQDTGGTRDADRTEA